MKTMFEMRQGRPFIMTMVFLPENRCPGERMYTPGDPPGCMCAAWVKMCEDAGLILENKRYLFQDYEGKKAFWLLDGKKVRKTREEMIFVVTGANAL